MSIKGEFVCALGMLVRTVEEYSSVLGWGKLGSEAESGMYTSRWVGPVLFWQYRWDLIDTLGSRIWIWSAKIKWVISVWCRRVYRLGSLVFWTLGNMEVGPSVRHVVSMLVWEPLYLRLERVVVIRRSGMKCKCSSVDLELWVRYRVGFWIRSRVGYHECFV